MGTIEMMPFVWGAVILATIIIEFSTSDLDAIWFTVGAGIALILSVSGIGLLWQLVIFLLVTTILIFTVGRWTKKLFAVKNVLTNTQSLIGREILVIEDADDFKKGSGVINDVVWTLICLKGEKTQKGDHAKIIAIDGNKLIVEKVK